MQSPQVVPSLGHIEAPHTPPLHCPLQHWAALAHFRPSALHASPPQTPPAHVPLQHVGVLGPHAEPGATHTCEPHVPSLHTPTQQGLLASQGMVQGVQSGMAQRPPVQTPVQHWLAALQATPTAEHDPQDRPHQLNAALTQVWSQAVSQQEGSMAQTLSQTPGMQACESLAPTVQTSWGHALGGPQVPPVQTPVQQSPSFEHASPSDAHVVEPPAPPVVTVLLTPPLPGPVVVAPAAPVPAKPPEPLADTDAPPAPLVVPAPCPSSERPPQVDAAMTNTVAIEKRRSTVTSWEREASYAQFDAGGCGNSRLAGAGAGRLRQHPRRHGRWVGSFANLVV